MWRISDDVWDVWAGDKKFPQSVFGQFARLRAWQPYARPGNWPDADMLPIGELKPNPGDGKPRTSRLTPDEERTQVTLWLIARSPLIVGANLTMLDPYTTSLLTDRDVIRVNQTATASREAMHRGDVVAWTADLPGGEVALALFNPGGHAGGCDGWAGGVWSGCRAVADTGCVGGEGAGRGARRGRSLLPHGSVLLMLRRP